jgi:hypothetical protein
VESLRGCHIKVLDKINSKFFMKLKEINAKFNKNDDLILKSITVKD